MLKRLATTFLLVEKIELDKLTIDLIASNILLISLKDKVTIEENDIVEVKNITSNQQKVMIMSLFLSLDSTPLYQKKLGNKRIS